jgi:prepilin-type N-terminal cleavage/methylation domain-containing protein
MSLRRVVSAARGLREAAGFSLVELLVVVLIVGLIAAIAAITLVRVSRRLRFRGTAMEIQSTLLAARMRAIRRNQRTAVFFRTAAPTESFHLVETIEGIPPAPTPTPAPVAHLMLSSNAARFVTLPPGATIVFDGDGRRVVPSAPTPGTIIIEGPAGSTNQITIQTSIGGRVSVVTPAVWQ